ncbi:MAG: serine hydrolase domain-containing protein [Baekduia sp.]
MRPTPEFDAACEELLAGGMGTSVLLVAETADARVERAYGVRYDDRPAAVSDLVPLYCSAKPVLALAFLSICAERGIDLDTRLRELLPWMEEHWIGAHTYAELLGHRTSIHRLGAVFPMATEPGRRGDLLRHLPEPGPDDQPGYADFGAWYLLAQTVETLTKTDFRQVAVERVLAPYGIDLRDLNLGIPPALFERWREDISINLYRRRDSGLHPLAAEGAAIWACEWNPAFAAYGTPVGLVQLYRAVLADREGAGRVISAELARLATSPGEVFYDARLGHDSRYGLGFMADMRLFHGGPSVSPRSFGQSGVGAGSLAFADPDCDLAASIVINTVFDEQPDLLHERPRLVSALYRDFGLSEEAGP